MTVLDIRVPVPAPLKANEKDKLIGEIVSSFNSVGISEVKIEEPYYLDLRSDIEPLVIVLIINVIADIVTIALGIRDFLKKPEAKNIREFRMKKDSESIVIKGAMSSEEITEILSKVVEIEQKDNT